MHNACILDTTQQIHLQVHQSRHMNNIVHLGDDRSMWIQFTELAMMKLYHVFQVTNVICEARSEQIVGYLQHLIRNSSSARHPREPYCQPLLEVGEPTATSVMLYV